MQPRKWSVARQCDVRYTEELVNAPTKAKCLDRCEEVRRRLNFSWNPRDDKYGYEDPAPVKVKPLVPLGLISRMESAAKSASKVTQPSLLEIKESLRMIKHMTHKQAYMVKLYREAYIQKFFLEEMNHESPGGIKYRKRRRGILAKKRMHVNSMEAVPQDASSGTNSAIKGGNAGCKPVCPGKDTLFACFNTDWRFYRELIAKSFGKSPSGNTELVKTWQACPKNPTAVIPCGNEKRANALILDSTNAR